jgi:site-specific DNA-methyltransferase (adenine-specific)
MPGGKGKIKVSDIKLNPSNPRVIKDERFQKLVNSIKDFPKMMALRPMVVDENNIVLGGNMRLKAIQELGMKEIPEDWVKKASDLTEEEQRRFIIADNIGFGENDWDMLQAEWDIDELESWGMEIPNFMVGEAPEAEEDNYEIPDEIETNIVPGDLIEIGEHRLICGDSTQTDTYERLFDKSQADLVITDPPYNVDYTGKTKDALKIKNDKKSDSDFYQFLYDFYTAQSTVCKDGGSWYIWFADVEIVNFGRAFIDAGMKLAQMLIWQKDSMVMGRKDYHFKHEPCLYGWKEGSAHSWYSDRRQTTILEFDRPSRSEKHPTMKPIPLIAYQMTNSSKAGDIVSDPFLGSGTTMVAAHQLGRKCYGIELDPKYCQVIIDRMKELDPSLKITINGKEREI